MAIKIGVANRKGGIGKTTTALALVSGLKRRGKRVLLIDTDPQRNSSNVFKAEIEGVATLYDIFFAGYKAKDCIQDGDIIASDIQLQGIDSQITPGPKIYKYIKNAIFDVENDYDYIVFDTPPATGVLLGNVLMCCEYLIIPCTCDSFGIQGVLDFYETIAEYQEDNEKLRILGLLIIKYKGRQNLTKDLEDNLLPEYAKKMGTKIFKTKIRESVRCQEAQALSQSIFDYAGKSTTALDYDELIDEILQEVE